MRASLNDSEVCICNMKYLHWTIGQMVAHHTETGCNLKVGDLLATGTISGPDGTNDCGCLLEASCGGIIIIIELHFINVY